MRSRTGNQSGKRGPRLEPWRPRDRVEVGVLQHPQEARHRAKCFSRTTAFHPLGNSEADVIPTLLRKLRPREGA